MSNELPGCLETLLTDNQLEYTHKEKVCFFGSYASVPSKFCFAPGERLMILKMVRHVKEMVDKQGLQHYADESIVPKRSLLQISMVNSVFGLVYGVHEKPKVVKTNKLVIDTAQHQKILFEKAMATFSQFQEKDLQPNREFSVNMVEIKTDGDKIKGKVSCIFCEGNNLLSVFRKTTGNWVLTNLTSHINNKHLKQENEIVKRCEMLTINTDGDADDKAGSSEMTEHQMSDELFTQISTQCIKMENTVSRSRKNSIKALQNYSTKVCNCEILSNSC